MLLTAHIPQTAFDIFFCKKDLLQLLSTCRQNAEMRRVLIQLHFFAQPQLQLKAFGKIVDMQDLHKWLCRLKREKSVLLDDLGSALRKQYGSQNLLLDMTTPGFNITLFGSCLSLHTNSLWILRNRPLHICHFENGVRVYKTIFKKSCSEHTESAWFDTKFVDCNFRVLCCDQIGNFHLLNSEIETLCLPTHSSLLQSNLQPKEEQKVNKWPEKSELRLSLWQSKIKHIACHQLGCKLYIEEYVDDHRSIESHIDFPCDIEVIVQQTSCRIGFHGNGREHNVWELQHLQTFVSPQYHALAAQYENGDFADVVQPQIKAFLEAHKDSNRYNNVLQIEHDFFAK